MLPVGHVTTRCTQTVSRSTVQTMSNSRTLTEHRCVSKVCMLPVRRMRQKKLSLWSQCSSDVFSAFNIFLASIDNSNVSWHTEYNPQDITEHMETSIPPVCNPCQLCLMFNSITISLSSISSCLLQFYVATINRFSAAHFTVPRQATSVCSL